MKDQRCLSRQLLFDYGCGHGDDVRALNKLGIQAAGWDPAHSPDTPKRPADIVNLGYVVNVIEDPKERAWVLQDAWSLAKKLLVVAARLESDRRNLSLTPYADGGITSIGTFQKFYDQEELRHWIDSVLGERSVPAAPGIFYVFRDTAEREQFLSRRYRRRSAGRPSRHETLEVFEANQDLFHKLANFWESHGRLPAAGETEDLDTLGSHCGNLRRAFTILQKATGADHWNQVRAERREDLLVYLALSRFGNRPKISQLPRPLQLDIKALFSSYSKGCAEADAILFSLGEADTRRQFFRRTSIGKHLPTALYVHVSAFDQLPPAIRIYEGCARVLVGEVEFANVIKLSHKDSKISYLEYPDFEKDPHPALGRALTVDLRKRRERYRDYREVTNPPILHRKEEFVTENHLDHAKFARLTRQEERAGLYESPSTVGSREGWNQALEEKGKTLRGHRLIRAPQARTGSID